MKHLSRLILKVIGWKTTTFLPADKKCIIIAAPHTSNWDFLLGWLFYKSIGGKPSVMIKDSVFFFPLNILLKAMGAIPVDRKPGNRMIEKMAAEFQKRDFLQVAIAPEGTRKPVKKWKKGFLLIARRANIPIYLGYADYKKKELGIIDKFYPTDDSNADMKKLKSFYREKGVSGRFPENSIMDE